MPPTLETKYYPSQKEIIVNYNRKRDKINWNEDEATYQSLLFTIKTKLNGHVVKMLLDPGSTHTIIRDSLCE